MKQYFDFNSFEKSIRKSLFEGIDLDDEDIEDIEDVQFEKPTSDNNELFKEEQFRMMTTGLLNAIPNDIKFEEEHSYGSYIKDGQKHYTYVFRFHHYGNCPYMFDYCFETNNLIIWNCESAELNFIFLDFTIIQIISECKYPVNIYYGALKCVLYERYSAIASRTPVVYKNVTEFCLDPHKKWNDDIRRVSHKFFDKFKGLIFDFKDPTNGMERTLKDLKRRASFEVRNDRKIWLNMLQNHITDY